MTSVTAEGAPVAFTPRRRYHPDWGAFATAGGLAVAAVIAGYSALTLLGRTGLAPTRGLDLFAAAFMIGVGAPAWIHWRRGARRDAVDARLPDFLRDLASLHKAGLTLQDSLSTAARGDYGALTPDVRWAAEQVRWNVPILTVLDSLMRRIGTPLAKRALTVVIEAGRTGGNVPEVLEIAGGNARAAIQLREERQRGMGTYTIITYVASFVFIGVTLALQGVFVPRMIEAFSKAGTSGALGFGQIPTAAAFRGLFYSAALVQAIGNGLIAGIMSDGRALAGLRHAWAMVALCLVGFLLSG